MKSLLSNLIKVTALWIVLYHYVASPKLGESQYMTVPIPEKMSNFSKFKEDHYSGQVMNINDEEVLIIFSKQGNDLIFYIFIVIWLLGISSEVRKYLLLKERTP